MPPPAVMFRSFADDDTQPDDQPCNLVAETLACCTLLLRYLLCIGPRPARRVPACNLLQHLCSVLGAFCCAAVAAAVSSRVLPFSNLQDEIDWGRDTGVYGSHAEQRQQQRQALRHRGLRRWQGPADRGTAAAEGLLLTALCQTYCMLSGVQGCRSARIELITGTQLLFGMVMQGSDSSSGPAGTCDRTSCCAAAWARMRECDSHGKADSLQCSLRWDRRQQRAGASGLQERHLEIQRG